MDTEIFKTLKSSFLSSSHQSDFSLVELCITELSSGNFIKAVDFSEELIKKDSNNSVGWALKAMAQAYLFDYDKYLYYLKSSFSSLDEFQLKTPLEKTKIVEVESLFIITLLERTIQMVTERVELVEKLKQQSYAQKENAKTAYAGAALSGFAGIQSKSNVGRILGFSGAVAGIAAGKHFEDKSNLLEEAAKGVFGVAIANIAFTVNSAKKLKNNLSMLNDNIKNEALIILQNWMQALIYFYKRLINDLYNKSALMLDYSPARNPTLLVKSSNDLMKTNQYVQFKFLSEILELDSSNKFYEDSIEGLNYIQNLNKVQVSKIKKEIYKYLFLFIISPIILWVVISFLLSKIGIDSDSLNLFFFLIIIISIVVLLSSSSLGNKSKILDKKKKQYLNGLKNLYNYVSNDSKVVESNLLKS